MGVDTSGTPRVLYVDPDEGARAAAADAFEAVGLSALPVESRAEAEEAAVEPGVVCVVAERSFPGGDALSLFGTLGEAFPALPTVVVTADGSESFASEAFRAGVSDYLQKPTATTADAYAEVAERVRDLVEDGRRDAERVRTRTHRASTAEVSAGDVSTDGASTPPEGFEPDELAAREADRGPTGEPVPVPADVAEPLKERAMDEAPVGITIADMSHDEEPLMYINQAFERLTGFTAAEARGHNCRFLQGPKTSDDPVETLRAAIEAEEAASVELLNYRKSGERFWNRVDVAPIFDDDGELTHYVGFQTDVTQRKRAESAAERRAAAVERERENLERLVDRVNGLIQDVTAMLVSADSRGAIERQLCERVAEAEPYAFAWVGERDLATDEVVPSSAAPGDDGFVSQLGVSFGEADPVRRAVEERELTVVDDSADSPGGSLHGGDWPDRFRSMAAVPLVYRGSLYGVLAVYATEPGAFDDRERVVLTALGRATATALNSLETQRSITTDEVTELEFDITGTDLFLVDLAESLGCRLEYAGAVEASDGRLRLLFDATGTTPAAVCEQLADTPVSTTVVTETDDGALLEFDPGESGIVERLAERGVSVRTLSVAPGESRLTVQVPRGIDDRGIAEFVERRYGGADLLAYRSEERQTKTEREFLATIEERLTERQRSALQRAYAGGFFEWPRTADGDDLADAMGVSRSTFHQHLRAAERKLVTAFYDGLD